MTNQTNQNPTVQDYRDIYIPKEANKRVHEDSDAVVYTYTRTGKYMYIVLMFHGRAKKPDYHYSYKTSEEREDAINKFFASRETYLNYRKEQREKRKATDRGLEIGDVLVSSWGYDQTNVDFYQVVNTYGKFGVVLRIIAASLRDTGFMCGQSKPISDNFKGEPFKKMAKNGSIRMASYAYARKTDPQKEHYTSWYA